MCYFPVSELLFPLEECSPKEMLANNPLKIKIQVIYTKSANLPNLYWAWGFLFSAGKTPFRKRPQCGIQRKPSLKKQYI